MISDGIRDTTYDPESKELDKDIPKSLIELYETPWREYLNRKNYDKNVSNMCRNCQKEQIQKYGEIRIKCKGPRSIDIVPEEIIQVMTQEELDKVKQSVDPYYWAERNIDIFQKDPEKRLFNYRWYQDIQIKCLHGDSQILMSDGSKKKIKDINIGDRVVSYNETRRSTPINKVLNKWNNGKKEVFRITLENGDYLDATADHKILGWIRTGRENKMLECPSFKTDYGSISSGDIKVGTDIYVLNKYKKFGKERNSRRLKRGAFNTSTRVKIVSIESIGIHDVYDIEVENRHNFIANNVIVHNCSASKKAIRCGRRAGKSYGLSLDIFERMMNIPNYQVLVVTPFLSQAKELADTIRKLVRAVNPELGDWNSIVARSVTSPYQEIRFTNGSTFKAFTAGNDNANAVRGQGAHLIVVDEADFLSQEAFDSIMAILMDKPNTEIICTSTPMGENIMFKLSSSKDYKEFHFPSFVIPHYNDDMDQANRENLSVNGYLQEIMALYSLDDRAVFQPDFINNAVNTSVSVPIYDVLANRDSYIVSLGCDWNADRVGTRICILAYSKSEGKMFIANMANVRKEGWTQVAAIEKIVDLNRQYKPDYIYVDEGFGEANVQQLKLIALESYGKVPVNHPDLKLSEIVPINFASTLELKDAITGEIRKKYFKNFIVETTKRALEKGVLALADPVCESVVEQMKGYMIKSRIAGGREVYEPKTKELGDHDLDAFMLALCAIHMNEESILDTSILSNFTAIPMAKGNYEYSANTKNIEGRRYTEEKPPSRRSLPKGVGSRSDIGIGSFGRSYDRAAAFGQMKKYRKNMGKSYKR